MAYFFIVPLWMAAVIVMGVITLSARFVPSIHRLYPFAWRVLLWSSVGFLLSNAIAVGLLFVPGLFAIELSESRAAAYGFAAVVVLAPIMASIVGFLSGGVIGVWLAVRAMQSRDTEKAQFI